MCHLRTLGTHHEAHQLHPTIVGLRMVIDRSTLDVLHQTHARNAPRKYPKFHQSLFWLCIVIDWLESRGAECKSVGPVHQPYLGCLLCLMDPSPDVLHKNDTIRCGAALPTAFSCLWGHVASDVFPLSVAVASQAACCEQRARSRCLLGRWLLGRPSS